MGQRPNRDRSDIAVRCFQRDFEMHYSICSADIIYIAHAHAGDSERVVFVNVKRVDGRGVVSSTRNSHRGCVIDSTHKYTQRLFRTLCPTLTTRAEIVGDKADMIGGAPSCGTVPLIRALVYEAVECGID